MKFDVIKFYSKLICELNNCYFYRVDKITMLDMVFNQMCEIEMKYEKFQKTTDKLSKKRTTDKNLQKVANLQGIVKSFEKLNDFYVNNLYYLLDDFSNDPGNSKRDYIDYIGEEKPYVRIHAKSVVEMFKEIEAKDIKIDDKEYLLYLKSHLDERDGTFMSLTKSDVNHLKHLNSLVDNKYNFVIWEKFNFKGITFNNGKGEDVFSETLKVL